MRGDAYFYNASNNLVFSGFIARCGWLDRGTYQRYQRCHVVAHKNSVQDVKVIVDCLRKEKRPEAVIHPEVYWPWGSYDSIDSGKRFQVKRITVKLGATLSLQKNHHRAEHWIVVSGTAEVSCDDKTFLLTENQSTYIPLGATHRLENLVKLYWK